MRALWLVPATIALGALCSRFIFPLLHKPDAVLTQPLPVVTGWGTNGIEAWLLYALTMAMAGVTYVRAVVVARTKPPSKSAIIAAVLLSMLAAFAFRFMFSSDVYAYAAYGALAATHQNPYLHRLFPPAQLVDAHWTAAIGYEWPSLPACIYGPAFVLFSQAVVVATHFDLAHALFVLRVVEIAAFATALALAPNPLLAVVVGLNPVVISTVAEGHNDALILLASVLAFVLARRSQAWGGALAGMSMLLKATGGVVACALAYAVGDRRFTWAALAGIAVAATVQLAAIRSWGGHLPLAATDFVGTPQAAIAIALRGLLALALVGCTIYHAGRGARARALATAALAMWALYPNDYPWYGMWLCVIAAFTLDAPEGAVLIALSFTSILRYLSDVYGYAPAAPWLEVAAVAIPLALYAKGSAPSGSRRRTNT